MSKYLPLLIIFDLYHTLWNFYPDQVVFPCNKTGGEIINKYGQVLKAYPEVINVFEKLKQIDIKIAISDACEYINDTVHLISLFGWDRYISYKQLDIEEEEIHLMKIHNQSNIPFDKMILFVNDKFVFKEVKELGVLPLFVHRKYGISVEVLNNGIKQYEKIQIEKENKTDDVVCTESTPGETMVYFKPSPSGIEDDD